MEEHVRPSTTVAGLFYVPITLQPTKCTITAKPQAKILWLLNNAYLNYNNKRSVDIYSLQLRYEDKHCYTGI